MDGFKNNPIFKQKLQDPKSRNQGACLASVMVPLQLVTIIKKRILLIWQNCRCNSPYSCRPLRYEISVWPKPCFSVRNRNQGPISVLVSEPKKKFLNRKKESKLLSFLPTSWGNASFISLKINLNLQKYCRSI